MKYFWNGEDKDYYFLCSDKSTVQLKHFEKIFKFPWTVGIKNYNSLSG